MTEEQIYFKHLAGVSAFMGWCRRWSQMPNGVSLAGHIASLGPVAVQRFGVAWPKKKRFADRPSLLFQETEGKWIENVQWARALLEKGEGHYALILVSRLVLGDESKYMNLPVFAVRIPISQEQGQLWCDLAPESVPLRMLWQDDDEVHVAAPTVDLPLTLISHGSPVFLAHETQASLSFHEMLEHRLRNTGIEANPGFKGAGGVEISDPYLKQQVAYRAGLKAADDIAKA